MQASRFYLMLLSDLDLQVQHFCPELAKPKVLHAHAGRF